jgi:O-antigen/teichoic acid export membrane protein
MSVDRGFNAKFFAYVMPVYFGSLTSTLMGTIDRVILPALTNLSLSAVYTYSLTIATVVTAITSPFSFFLLPKISQAFASSHRSQAMEYSHASLELFYHIALPATVGVVSYLALSIVNSPFSGDTKDVVNSIVGSSHPFVVRVLTFLAITGRN